MAPYIDNRPMLVAGKPELREYKAVFVRNDQEVSLFSDEITENCARWCKQAADIAAVVG